MAEACIIFFFNRASHGFGAVEKFAPQHGKGAPLGIQAGVPSGKFVATNLGTVCHAAALQNGLKLTVSQAPVRNLSTLMFSGAELQALLTWLGHNGITWNTRMLDIRGGDNGAAPFAIFAVQDVNESETLCEIPKSAVLSVKNTEIADLIEQEQLGGGLGLILAIMFECSIGLNSKWHGYLQSLPKREYLPLFWTDEELALLAGTELAGKASDDRAYTKDDWEAYLLPLVQQGKHPQLSSPSLTLDLFRVAASWVASRAFGVDSYHGMAMVPLADLFNHKAAVVQLGGGYTVEDVCFEDMAASDQEGSDSDAAEERGDSDAAKEGPNQADEADVFQLQAELQNLQEHEQGNMLQPMTLEADRGGSTRGAMLDPSLHQDPKLKLEIGICGNTKADGTEVLEIVAASPLEAGKEIFNTYGEHGNAELVNKYGFALRDNPFDTVELDKQQLVALAKQQHGSKACKKRCRFLDDHSHLLEEDEEPFEVLPNGKMNPSLLMGLRVLFATAKQFAAWQTLDDALPPVDAPDAAAFVQVTETDTLQNTDTMQERPDLSTSASRKRSVLDNNAEQPTSKRQKAQSLPVQHQDAAGVSTHAAGQTGLTAQANGVNGKSHKGTTQEEEKRQEEEQEEDLSGSEDVDESAGGSQSEPEEAQLGNISIADSSEEVLSTAMLHALTGAIQLRLQQYASSKTAPDELALQKAQAAARRHPSEALQALQAAYQLLIGEKNILNTAVQAVDACWKNSASS